MFGWNAHPTGMYVGYTTDHIIEVRQLAKASTELEGIPVYEIRVEEIGMDNMTTFPVAGKIVNAQEGEALELAEAMLDVIEHPKEN